MLFLENICTCSIIVWHDKRLLFLLTVFFSHFTRLDLIQAERRLNNVKIMFLPLNNTSMSQPLNQGIIQTQKAYYRRQWLQYVIQEWELRHDPSKSVNVLHAL